jgi:ribosomal protein L40E
VAAGGGRRAAVVLSVSPASFPPGGAGSTLPDVSDVERRCPRCEALVSPDAEWCGQCFADLRPPPAPPPPIPTTTTPAPSLVAPVVSATDGDPAEAPVKTDPFWPCSVCGTRNPIFLEVCEVCGTPFATVMRGVTRRDVDPRAALTRSLVFPGAGHAMLGYQIDGFARGVLFILSLGIAIFLSVAGLHTGPMLLAILLSLGLAIGVYVVSALEIKDLAARGRLMVPSKYLLWGSVGVMFLVVGAIAMSVATSGRR